MNTLSWLLYFAEISERISSTAMFLTAVSAAVFTVIGFFNLILERQFMSDSFRDQAPKARNAAAAIFFISLLGQLFPSQDTIYLIIASEAAEVVATDETTQQLLGDVKDIVSLKLEQIAEDMLPAEPARRN